MKTFIINTKHPINETVSKAILEGLPFAQEFVVGRDDWKQLEGQRVIGYGILRGCDAAFRLAGEYWNVDKAFFLPGHFHGYYRFSLNDIQPHFDGAGVDNFRAKRIVPDILPWRFRPDKPFLLCPPTEAVCDFKKTNSIAWRNQVYDHLFKNHDYRWRFKGSEIELADDLADCRGVITYNSSVGIEALRLGVPVISWPDSSIGHWSKITIDNWSKLEKHYQTKNRQEFFNWLASRQFTLSEIRAGALCNLINLPSSSAGTAASQ